MAWILSQRLVNEPGGTYAYSNEGYLALGLVVEAVSGVGLLNYHRAHILTPDMWVPWTDFRQGRTFREDQPAREAWYDSAGEQSECVYPRDGLPACFLLNRVDEAYGGWDHEARIGQGGLIASAATMLEFAKRYDLAGWDIGVPVNSPIDGTKNGALTGTNTYLVQRSDGVNVFIFFNKDGSNNFAESFYDNRLNNAQRSERLGNQNSRGWPTTDVGGFWVDPDRTSPSVLGSYDYPFADLDEALGYLADGSRVNFHPGSSAWTGTISTKLVLKAPLGTVIVGEPP